VKKQKGKVGWVKRDSSGRSQKAKIKEKRKKKKRVSKDERVWGRHHGVDGIAGNTPLMMRQLEKKRGAVIGDLKRNRACEQKAIGGCN